MSPRTQERGQGPALVFLHGIGGDAACWRPQLDVLSHALRAIAWNMPGYGGAAPLARDDLRRAGRRAGAAARPARHRARRTWSAIRWAAWWRRSSRRPSRTASRSLSLYGDHRRLRPAATATGSSASSRAASGRWSAARTMADLAAAIVAGLGRRGARPGRRRAGRPQHGGGAGGDLPRRAALPA